MGTLYHALMIACWVVASDAAGTPITSRDPSGTNVSQVTGAPETARPEVGWRWDDPVESSESALSDTSVDADDAWNMFWPEEEQTREQQEAALNLDADDEPVLVPLPTPVVLAISGLVTALIIYRRQNRR